MAVRRITQLLHNLSLTSNSSLLSTSSRCVFKCGTHNPMYCFNQVIATTTTRQYYSTDPVITEPKSTQYQLGYEHIPELEESSEDFKKIYKLEFASKQEWNKKIKAEMIKKLQQRDGDTGSTSVQVGVLTARIQYLTEHMRNNKKDKSCLRRLLHLVHKRRKLLVYLRRTDFTRYHELLEQLNLRPLQDSKYGYIKKE